MCETDPGFSGFSEFAEFSEGFSAIPRSFKTELQIGQR